MRALLLKWATTHSGLLHSFTLSARLWWHLGFWEQVLSTTKNSTEIIHLHIQNIQFPKWIWSHQSHQWLPWPDPADTSSALMLLDLSLQYLTLLTSLCLPRQNTPDFFLSSQSPLPIISSACPQMPMVCTLSLLSRYILSLSTLSSSLDLSNANIQKIHKCVSNPATFS